MNVSEQLDGKVAIVCGAEQTPGATTGNGKAIALLFARAGARVVCVDRDGERAQHTVAEIEAKHGVAIPLTADVKRPGDAQRIVHAATEQFGTLAILVNNVGIGGGGFQVAYETSKAALNRMTRSVVLSAAKHQVRCNAIAPGLMDTPMAIGGISNARGISTKALREERSAQVPMQHMGDAWDTAYAALFLASDESRFISGTVLPVDGAQGAKIG